ncbi:hypothetical protein Tco_1238811 [Tanacetum coccineum]
MLVRIYESGNLEVLASSRRMLDQEEEERSMCRGQTDVVEYGSKMMYGLRECLILGEVDRKDGIEQGEGCQVRYRDHGLQAEIDLRSIVARLKLLRGRRASKGKAIIDGRVGRSRKFMKRSRGKRERISEQERIGKGGRESSIGQEVCPEVHGSGYRLSMEVVMAVESAYRISRLSYYGRRLSRDVVGLVSRVGLYSVWNVAKLRQDIVSYEEDVERDVVSRSYSGSLGWSRTMLRHEEAREEGRMKEEFKVKVRTLEVRWQASGYEVLKRRIMDVSGGTLGGNLYRRRVEGLRSYAGKGLGQRNVIELGMLGRYSPVCCQIRREAFRSEEREERTRLESMKVASGLMDERGKGSLEEEFKGVEEVNYRETRAMRLASGAWRVVRRLKEPQKGPEQLGWRVLRPAQEEGGEVCRGDVSWIDGRRTGFRDMLIFVVEDGSMEGEELEERGEHERLGREWEFRKHVDGEPELGTGTDSVRTASSNLTHQDEDRMRGSEVVLSRDRGMQKSKGGFKAVRNVRRDDGSCKKAWFQRGDSKRMFQEAVVGRGVWGFPRKRGGLGRMLHGGISIKDVSNSERYGEIGDRWLERSRVNYVQRYVLRGKEQAVGRSISQD